MISLLLISPGLLLRDEYRKKQIQYSLATPGVPVAIFCDALEMKDDTNAPAVGWGLENAINSCDLSYYAYAKFL